MKTLIVSLAIWIFVVPAVVTAFLIFTFLVAHSADRYFTFSTVALAFSILTMVWGPFWLEPFSSASSWLFSKSQQRTNSIQEKKYEKHLEGHVRS
jgi:high-affinity Fe2+/Pb2+ permease